MTTRSAPLAAGTETDEQIQLQLNRITGSKTFQQVDRLKRFVSFIVLETLAGRGDQLKEFVVGIQVFGKDASFDPRMDPIVRVQARRLRTRLSRYYREEGRNDEIVIDLPKGGYSPVFKRTEGTPPRRSVTAALFSRNSIVVMPFSDDSATGDFDYFCRGLRQEIIHSLAKVDTLRVVAADKKQPGENPGRDHAVGRNDAALIIGGSVRKSGNMLRITAQLLDAASGCYLWSESFDRQIDAAFEIQEEISRAILEKLQAGLVDGGHSRGALRPTENLAAHNLYLQGRYHLNQRTDEGLRKAAEFFEKVIVEDGQYVQAYCGLADACGLLAHYGVLPPMEVWTRAASSAAWAVLQDENSAEAHTSLAHVKATQDWDWIGADKEYQQAIRLDPRYPTARHWYAMSCLVPMARLDDALEQMWLAQELDPVSSIIARDAATVLYYRRDYEGALEQCDHTIELNPYFSPAYWTLGLIQEQLGDFDESVAALQRAIQLSPQSPRMLAALARTLALRNQTSEALAILEGLRDLAKKRYVSPFEFAWIHLALGETDVGFEWLLKAFQDRCYELVSIKADPRFDSFRTDSRYTAICDQVGLL